MNEKILALEMYSKQIEAIQKEIASVRVLKNEINKAIETLSNVKVDEETLIPVGPGVYLKAKVIDDKALLGVKSDIYIEKSLSESIEDLKKSYEELDNVEKEGLKRLNELSKVIAELKEELQKEAEKMEKEKKD
ncbi:prefoldin, alpha subunit [Methanocaldococcus infernus ME]|uniref:Prefoldin subunit alpha n=1 Tax=Methanocaldococcus infernus (strain DSM 11812 / JCM 15783 / ME) TaxID=573063 RepID=D5VSS3_METIM|nr:prefoldin subunit alpha [Methanocaldococcus infernus]ADG13626.1 prefoldin, alpha subunit [Methanocaldococcus infernus ME]